MSAPLPCSAPQSPSQSQSLPLPLLLGPADGAAPWHDTLPPTRSAALARIARVRPAAYARNRNHLDGAVTGLSPYLTHGLVTLREVLAGVLQQGPLPVQHKLVFELGWRAFFRHAWAHAGDGIFQSLHAGPRPDDAYADELPADIREARTGVPAIDEAVRKLYATGTLHNHARMWLASYVVHLRHVHWRAGADWLVVHLLDGDLASNHLSWQWVAGTGSHKPYLFNADNVARYAPPQWHSPGTVLDQGYDTLDRAARGPRAVARAGPAGAVATPEPPLHAAPPAGLGVQVLCAASAAAAAERLRGREVWLVHPWALRAPASPPAGAGALSADDRWGAAPAGLPTGALYIGLYLQEPHAARPWPEARWRWVDAALAAVAPERWHTSAAHAAVALAGAAQVRAVDDPHLTRWLQPLAQLDPAPALFPPVQRPCTSFSQWWTRTTRGLTDAGELL